MQHEAFQIADDAPAREVWGRLPTFTRYGIVDAAKPAAQIWAVHASEKGPQGPRILLASQRYGAGLSAVCCVQNFWRWRLAREADTRQFDRFWRQFFRFLGESSRQEISLALADQDIRIGSELEVVVERQPAPQSTSELPTQHRVRVEDPNRKIVLDETVELAPRRPISLKFPTAAAGNYTVTALDAAGVVVAARSVEVRDVNVELMLTARNMELLRQWATVSGGNAIKAEDCQDAGALVDSAVRSAESIRRRQSVRRPLGANGWVLTALLAGLGIEWALRRRWQLA
jgi:hypothetical protein